MKTSIWRYRYSCLLNKCFNDSLLMEFFPTLVIGFGGFGFPSFFGTVRFAGKIKPSLYVFYPALFIQKNVAASLLFYISASLQLESTKCVTSIRSRVVDSNEICQKQVDGFRPFGVTFGFMAALERIHLLLIYDFATDMAISLLMAMPA